jgi:predicted RND superfamily exporter protein
MLKMKIYIDTILRNRWSTIAISLLLITLAFVGAFKNLTWSIPFKNDYKVFFKSDNEQFSAYQALQKSYGRSDSIAIIVSPKDGNLFTKASLEALLELTDAAWQVESTMRVESLINFQHSSGNDNELVIKNLVDRADLESDESIQKIRTIALSESLLVNKLVSKKGEVAIVNVTVMLPDEGSAEAAMQISTSAKNLIADFATRYPQIDFQLSGVVIMNATFSEIAFSDGLIKIPLMLLGVLAIMVLLQRSFLGAGLTLIIIIASTAATIGIWGWLGGFLTAPSTTAPIVILTIAVADCVHIISTYARNLTFGMDKYTAVRESVTRNFKAVFLTSLSTAFGFLTMNFSDAPPFVDLGNIVAIGVTIAFVLSVTLLPALMMVFPAHSKILTENHKRTANRVSTFAIKHQKNILLVSLLLTIGALISIPKNELNDDFVTYFDHSTAFRKATEHMQQKVSGMTTIELSIDSLNSNGVSDPEFMQHVSSFVDWLNSLDKIDHIYSISDILKRLNKNMNADNPEHYRLPDQKELISQYLLLYELSLPQGQDINNLINVDRSSTRIIATFQNLTSKEILQLEQKILTHFSELHSPYELKLASPSLMFAHIGSSNIVNMLQGSVIALIFISAMMAIAFRSLKYGLISLVPNLIPISMAFGLWGICVGEIGIGLSVVACITLGIIVDDTIHFMNKYFEARKKQLTPEQSIHYVFEDVGRALWITTLVLAIGFSIMATSSLKINSDMGLLTVVTIIIALIADFLLLPALLLLFDKKKSRLDVPTQTSLQTDDLANPNPNS